MLERKRAEKERSGFPEAKLGTGDTPKQCKIRIDKSHRNAGLADELVPGGTDLGPLFECTTKVGDNYEDWQTTGLPHLSIKSGQAFEASWIPAFIVQMAKWSSELPGSSTVMFDRCSKR